MTAIPLVRLPALRPIFQLLARRKAPIETYAVRANISPAVLQKEEALIPLHQALRFLREAAAGEGLTNLGLLAGETATIETLGVYGRCIRRARTLGEAIDTVVLLDEAFNSGEQIWIEQDGDRIHLCRRFLNPLEPTDQLADHYCVALLVNLIRLAAGPRWSPTDVRMQTAFSPDVVTSPLFHQTRLEFEQPASMIAIPRSLLHRRMPTTVAIDVGRDDVPQWHASAPAGDVYGSMQQLLLSLAPRIGHVRIEHAAAALGVSVRTLQRRLADSGLSFEQVVHRMSLESATDLLARTDARILDIALDLGYSDHAHFTRAFRRWTGLSPVEYRRRHRAERAPDRHEAIPA